MFCISPIKRLGIIIVLIYMTIMPMSALASDYDVTAVVHAPLPLDLPIVTGPLNTLQENTGVFITGTCTVIVPTIIVVLTRDNQTIGSGSCLDTGTFSIYVGLILGTNVIYPKFLTITGLFSSNGAPITITHKLKEQPSSANNNEVVTPIPSDLTIGFDYDFVSYDNLTITKLKYTVAGGKPPYSVVVSWGDNSVKKYTVKSSGEQAIEHKYKTILPPSQITIQVTDSAGAKTTQSRALVSFRKGVYLPPAALPVKDSGRNWLPIWYIGAVSFGGILLLTHPRTSLTNYLKKINKKAKTKQTKSSKKR